MLSVNSALRLFASSVEATFYPVNSLSKASKRAFDLALAVRER